MAQQMSWREAVIEVLKDAPEGLSYTEIADQIIAKKLRTTFGATPGCQRNVALSDSIKSDKDTPFQRIATGRYKLTSTKADFKRDASQENSDEVTPEIAQKKQSTGLINALGMYWSRNLVHWSPATPKLLGRQTTVSEAVDFTDQRGVYLLYDRSEIVYVGRAIDQGIGTRLRQHLWDRLGSRWDRFSWFGIYQVSESGKLVLERQTYDESILIATMEALLIEAVEPKQNRRRGDEFQAIEFLQVEDPEIEKTRKQISSE